jgi:hypothetical protein
MLYVAPSGDEPRFPPDFQRFSHAVAHPSRETLRKTREKRWFLPGTVAFSGF